jgi:hypothetical protein
VVGEDRLAQAVSRAKIRRPHRSTGARRQKKWPPRRFELAKTGERDPERLCEGALKDLPTVSASNLPQPDVSPLAGS